MSKIIFFLIIVTLVSSCKDTVQDKSTIREVRWEETTDSLPQKTRVDAKAQTIINDWLEYNALDQSFDKIYTSEHIEDFQFLVDELIENQNKMELGEYPEKFNIPQIKGRQKLFKTYVLKAKGDLEYQQNPRESIIQMITAYNDLRNQFNVVVNNTLPDELLKNEEN
ncbi:hypothetical protein PXD56_02140 [Maribacter sp. SA7]|uniref:hypothetical protein n=1 Tax=Maribacter zhoushanensis TaxID=3030012 RepID=UPI0023EC7CF5|nr:hypothetical protein [Maribacter zhoushanensis]MDF4201737.1 hypothetical protein [Maribacter zhoushanensis]